MTMPVGPLRLNITVSFAPHGVKDGRSWPRSRWMIWS
jgi:hypothetical protein